MKNKDLMREINRLGFPLFETEEVEDANKVLYEVSKSEETRLWEGFPILLANAAKKGGFDYSETLALCEDKNEKDRLWDLIALSMAVYSYFHLRFLWAEQILKQFSENKKKKFHIFLECLRKNADLQMGDRSLNSMRVKNIFENYFEEEKQAKKHSETKYDELSLEYALSQIFPPKQKVLFFKKLNGEKMTKTEQEYYSRTVKKKIMALSNTELHRLSKRILGY